MSSVISTLRGNRIALEAKTLSHALSWLDLRSLLFFVGILLAVATLEHAKILETLAGWLDRTIGRQDVIVLVLGLLSAIVDNVPLVAASIGMYPLSQYPTDSFLWKFMAYWRLELAVRS